MKEERAGVTAEPEGEVVLSPPKVGRVTRGNPGGAAPTRRVKEERKGRRFRP